MKRCRRRRSRSGRPRAGARMLGSFWTRDQHMARKRERKTNTTEVFQADAKQRSSFEHGAGRDVDVDEHVFDALDARVRGQKQRAKKTYRADTLEVPTPCPTSSANEVKKKKSNEQSSRPAPMSFVSRLVKKERTLNGYFSDGSMRITTLRACGVQT